MHVLQWFRGECPREIKRSLTSHAKAELIYDVGSGYKFVSPFFREWIRRRVLSAGDVHCS